MRFDLWFWFRFVASARQLAKALEVPLVNDLGYTKRYVRCLQVCTLFWCWKVFILALFWICLEIFRLYQCGYHYKFFKYLLLLVLLTSRPGHDLPVLCVISDSTSSIQLSYPLRPPSPFNLSSSRGIQSKAENEGRNSDF